MGTRRIGVAAICAVCWMTCSTDAMAVQGSPAATAESVSVQQVGKYTYFQATIRWPSEGVQQEYGKFSAKEGSQLPWQETGRGWPVDALALISQGGEPVVAALKPAVEPGRESDRRLSPFGLEQELPNPAVFVGKTRTAERLNCLLRCPSAQGGWTYVPVIVDLTAAPAATGLDKEWLAAQAGFMRGFEAPSDQSFFAYARARYLARLGTSPPADEVSRRGTPGAAHEGLYDITTGALALQESLQLDRMLGTTTDQGTRSVPIEQVQGVTVRSHPWTKMIGGRKPAIEQIASLVPDDQYYLRFKTTQSLAEFLDFSEQWGGSLLGVAEAGGRDYRTREKIERQICLKSSWLSKLLGPAVIESLAITAYDPYLREGSDFSVIFHLKAPAVFELAANRYIEEARKENSGLQEGRFAYQGTTVETFITPDGTVRCHRAKMGEFYVYSNSPAAIRRIIDAYAGRRASLARSLDFVYMRTLYPLGDKDEDGFLFLSDAFIRMLVGPRVRIGEKRRIDAVTSMEMIKNAALLYLYENPRADVPTLDTLYGQGYLETQHIRAEPGDRFTWDPATFTAGSERYGRLGALTPLVELDVTNVTEREKADYEQFRDRYQDYWRRYFDPVGIRISTGPTVRLSMTILPLIDNSRYRELQEFTGGKAVSLEPIRRNGPLVLRLAAHLNPDNEQLQSLQSIGLSEMARNVPPAARKAMMWMGQRMEFWIEDSEALGAAVQGREFTKAFEIPIVLAVEVKNPFGLAGFLTGVQTMVRVSAPNTVVFEPVEPYKGTLLTRVRPAPESFMVQDGEHGEQMKNLAIYYGKIGRMLYASTSLPALQRIIDATPASQPATASGAPGDAPAGQSAPPAPDSDVKGHLALRFDLEKARKCRPALMYLLSSGLWTTEQEHLRNLWLLAHTVGLGPQAKAPPERVLGYTIDSALGNTYRYDPQRDEVVGSATGSLWSPGKRDDLPEGSPLRRLFESIRRIEAVLEFTSDGLRTDLTFERTSR